MCVVLHAEVPSGYIMNRGVVTPCPKGTFRDGLAAPTAQLNCTRCARGWTTTGVASIAVTECSRTLPGFNSASTSQGSVSSPNVATACPEGSWSNERAGADNAGLCYACGNGWWTKNNTLDTEGLAVGATSQSACGKHFSYGCTPLLVDIV